jgi:non-ribosomal peptide synthetase component E (peptide arylation enzyme)
MIYPNAIAVTYEKEKITYKELNERANQLAHYLLNSTKLFLLSSSEMISISATFCFGFSKIFSSITSITFREEVQDFAVHIENLIDIDSLHVHIDYREELFSKEEILHGLESIVSHHFHHDPYNQS